MRRYSETDRKFRKSKRILKWGRDSTKQKRKYGILKLKRDFEMQWIAVTALVQNSDYLWCVS